MSRITPAAAVSTPNTAGAGGGQSAPTLTTTGSGSQPTKSRNANKTAGAIAAPVILDAKGLVLAGIAPGWAVGYLGGLLV